MPKAPKLFFRYEGVFDFDALYNHMADFFKQRQYWYKEKKWTEKEATPAGREIRVQMEPEKLVTEYLKHEYSVDWKTMDAHPVTVERGGRSVELTKGRFFLHVEAELVTDWQKFEKEASWLKQFFEKYVFKNERNKVYMAALQEEMQAFVDSVKQHLGTEAR